jgi:hypothetical protein
MDDHSISGISYSSTSSTHSLCDSTMPPIDNDNVGCVGVGVGTQNPSSAFPPKPKKFEQTSIVVTLEG